MYILQMCSLIVAEKKETKKKNELSLENCQKSIYFTRERVLIEKKKEFFIIPSMASSSTDHQELLLLPLFLEVKMVQILDENKNYPNSSFLAVVAYKPSVDM